ncbi:MAG: hypothetical protein GX288_04785 [Clostridiales bacterium]|nr:hypothetical protein [Clostridiales bacterium]
MILKKKRREIVLFLDLIILILVSILFYMIFPNNVSLANQNYYSLIINIFILIFSGMISQFLFKTYDSLWRYAQSKEYLMLLLGGITGYLIYLLIVITIPGNSIPVLYTLSVYSVSLIGMLFMRLCYRQYRKYYRTIYGRIPIAIIGAGEAGVKLLEELQSNP